MPVLRQVPRSEVTDEIVTAYYDRLFGERAVSRPDLHHVARRRVVAMEEPQPVLLDAPAPRAAVRSQLLFGERLVERGRLSHLARSL